MNFNLLQKSTYIGILAILFSQSVATYGYIGPGMGLGALGVVLGVIFSVFLAIVAIFWYPFKRLIKKLKKPAPVVSEQSESATTSDQVSAEAAVEEESNSNK